MQWGIIAGFADDQIKTFSFPIPFPHKPFIVNFTTQSDVIGGGSTSSPFLAFGLTSTTFKVNTDPQAIHGLSNYMWFAIGY